MLPKPADLVRQITEAHHSTVVRWHECDPDNPYDGLLAIVCEQHQFNFLLWHEEDIARSPDVSDRRIAAVKHCEHYQRIRAAALCTLPTFRRCDHVGSLSNVLVPDGNLTQGCLRLS